MVHSHTVHLPLGALLSPCTMCSTGMQLFKGSLLTRCYDAAEVSLPTLSRILTYP